MNRPFPAFAALLALLALAMFAVSSSSRSTTVQPPQPRRKAATVNPVPGQSNFVFLVPAPAAEVSNDTEREFSATQLVSVVCVEAPRCHFEFERSGPTSLIPAKIGVAEVMAGIEQPLPPVDCRSHYDPIYDHIVYGSPASGAAATSASGQQPISALEMVAIFRDLRAMDRSQSGAAALWHWFSRGMDMRVGAYRAALQSWLRHYLGVLAQDLGLTCEMPASESSSLAWSEYSELLDAAETARMANAPASAPAAEGIVRFSDWLWRSAAATWSRTVAIVFTANSSARSTLMTAIERP